MIKNRIFGVLLRLKGSSPDRDYVRVQAALAQQGLLELCSSYLQQLLGHAYQNVPFYTRALSSICRNDRVDLDRLDRISLLTKDDIRRSQKELASKDICARKWHYNTSGGSTGEPVRFIQDKMFDRWTNVTTKYYYHNMIGIDELAVKKVLLWGSERDIYTHTLDLRATIVNWLTNTTPLNSFRMTQRDMEEYVRIINTHRPDLIRGYADSLYQISEFVSARGLNIHSPRVMVSAAEKLDKKRRETIERVFGTRVYDFYGSREVDGIAGECGRGMMHIFMFNNYIEVLPERVAPLKNSDIGRVIVTGLHNYSMPLIRYDVGDTAILGPANCGCGDPLPTLAAVTGRVSDHFLTRDGTLIHGEYFTHLFYFRDWVRSFQVIQEDLTRVRVLAAVGEANQHEMNDISDKIRLVMGQECSVIWEIVEEIPNSPSGKHIYTKSLISR